MTFPSPPGSSPAHSIILAVRIPTGTGGMWFATKEAARSREHAGNTHVGKWLGGEHAINDGRKLAMIVWDAHLQRLSAYVHTHGQTQTLDNKGGLPGPSWKRARFVARFLGDRSKGSVAEERESFLGFHQSNEGNDDDDESDEMKGEDEGDGATVSMKLDGSIVDDGSRSPWAL
ncbi:hypothetical protein EPUS_02386 [Endocarpon pusillum Z07020]|uniref:Uncharacterized protein n=1 Tax=Endocarpon pusillum (strain Z07020 / HMAS-L-300199) TaxID=1263415 RepID=U1HP84_ENDPU|nr:uncharacterized protein EPUS_02386 [Endocarpon pusillum Z07020]ERF70864.1 hypothetical protein EPUS_02386 [Endocarpon pusillum Z07020]